MSFPGLSSFRTRLMVGVVMTVALIQSIGAVHEVGSLKGQYSDVLARQAVTVTSLVGDAMVLPLWDFDMPQVERMISDLLRNDTIGRVQLYAPEGALVIQESAADYRTSSTDLVVDYDLKYATNGAVEYLGRLVVTMPTADLDMAIAQAVRNKLVVVMSIVATISVSLFVVLNRLAQPLVAFASIIERIRGGDLDLSIPAMQRSDEIGKVAQALDLLRRNESEVRLLRELNDERSRQETRRILLALESTRDAVVLTDETGRVVFCNAKAKSFFCGMNEGEPFQYSDLAGVEKVDEIAAAIDKQVNFSIETVVAPLSNQSQSNLLIRGGPIFGADQKFLGTFLLATDNTEQVRQAERARYNAEHDSLTGLPNRRRMYETLQTWLREGVEVSILLGDLDDFKLINDTLGHPVGDALLKHVAKIFRDVVRDKDTAIRLGGDEFAIIAIGDGGRDRLYKYGQILIDRLSNPQALDGRTLYTGLSVGIANITGTENVSSDLVRRADLALYEAKKKGRGRVEVFHESLEAVAQRKSILDTELRAALKSGGIFPVFQIQSDPKTRRIVGFEVLARWQHEKLGEILPVEFISVAEEGGLVRELTYQILSEACRAAVEWRALGFEGRIAVNVSPKLFGYGVAEFVKDCLFESGCPADAIEIEITETVVLANGPSTRDEIEALQKLGVTIALDDFGMGYSSLSYLQKFPVDKIKIDRAFVSKLPASSETRAIVVAIIELGHALGMQVTGEGAETERHRQELCDCNADILQGFVDGQPMCKEDAAITVKNNSHRSAAC